nr:hypothetical protein CFP56_63981 [Quercus suber]
MNRMPWSQCAPHDSAVRAGCEGEDDDSNIIPSCTSEERRPTDQPIDPTVLRDGTLPWRGRYTTYNNLPSNQYLPFYPIGNSDSRDVCTFHRSILDTEMYVSMRPEEYSNVY